MKQGKYVLVSLAAITIFIILLFEWSRMYSFVILKFNGYDIETMEYFGDDFFVTVNIKNAHKHYSVMFRSNYGDYFIDYVNVEKINNETLIGISCYSEKYKYRQNNRSQYIPSINHWHGIVVEKHPTKNQFNCAVNGILEMKNNISIIDSVFKSIPKYPEFTYRCDSNLFEDFSTRIIFDKYLSTLDSLARNHKTLHFDMDECNCQ